MPQPTPCMDRQADAVTLLTSRAIGSRSGMASARLGAGRKRPFLPTRRSCPKDPMDENAVHLPSPSSFETPASRAPQEEVARGETTRESGHVRNNPIVQVGKGPLAAKFGAKLPLALIAGPCQIESRAHALETAAALKEIAARRSIGLVYKSSFDKANRTSGAGARGVGLEASLAIFAEIRETVGLPVITDVHESAQCARVAEAVDALQIPAFLCRQTDLLIAARVRRFKPRRPPDCTVKRDSVL